MKLTTIADSAAFLRAHDDYLILTHIRPDGDTLCSAAALCSCLRRLGKRAAMFPNPEITENYADHIAPWLTDRPDGNACFVSVDVADANMLPEEFIGRVALAVDHHPKNPGFAEQTLLNGGKASCGEIVMELIETLCGNLTIEEANLLYIAVSTDSGCFCYGNTTAETLRAGAHLVDCGAENGRLNKAIFRSSSFARLKLEGMIFASLRSYRDHRINVAIVTLDMMRACGAVENDCEDIASLPGRIRGSVVNFMIRELAPGRSKASVRTSEQVDASAICARFGGGGHKMAAGCTYDGSPEELAEGLLRVVEEIWPE